MTRWEYDVVYDLSKKQLNEWGAAGWELVSVTKSHFYGITLSTGYFFKRKLL